MRSTGLLLPALAILGATAARAQLTTGRVEGVLRAPDGRPQADQPLVITGGVGFQLALRTDARGVFVAVLPYGAYRIAGIAVFVPPLQTVYVNLQTTPSTPGFWSDATRARVYPEPFSLPAILLSREPTAVTQPLDFTGLADNRLWLQSDRALSWTTTQFKLQGIDATDSYQPGRPLILPNVEALDDTVVRTGFAQTASTADGTEIGLFLAEPSPAWHATLSSADTGSAFAWSNVPPPATRGLVRQPDRFHWFTRDGLEVSGPLARWADIFASAAGQWASQTVPLAAPGADQRSRLLFANTRGRVRAGPHDQLSALYSGSRIDLSNGGVPFGIELLAANRIGPPFVLPGGFAGESEVDHLDFVQAAWTHEFAAPARGALQVRYGYSTAHLDTPQLNAAAASQPSQIELFGGSVTGAAPLGNFAIRTRHSFEAAWQPAARRHQFVLGAGWSQASPRNRFTVPSGTDIITANGAPAFMVRFNTPADSQETIRSFTAYAADRLRLPAGFAIDAGLLADFPRGSVPGQPGDLIAWNSLSPRAGFAWQVPRARFLSLRAAYFRLYAPLAGRYLDFGDPASLSGSEYAWQGPLLMRFGGQYSSIAPALARPYSDEFDIGAVLALPPRISAGVHLFRRDDKNRLAAEDIGVPASAYTPVVITDPSDNAPLTVYSQNPATLGQDRYLLTNPPGLREQYTGLDAEIRSQWHGVTAGVSFVAEKSWGPTNPGDAALTNDPGVLGALYLDPNTAINAIGHGFFDRAFLGKIYAAYRLPRSGIELSTVADYLDGLVFGRELLVTGLPQGAFLVDAMLRGSPEGGNRAQHVTNWSLRVAREFPLPYLRIAAFADLMNVTNAGHAMLENDLTSPAFNARLPVAIQAPRAVRLGFRLEF